MARELKLLILGDADHLDRELKRSNNALDRFGKQTKLTASVTSKGFAGIRGAATGAAAGLAGLAIAGKRVVDAAVESEKSQAALEAQLRAMDISYRAHADEIDAVIQKHSQLAGVDDEELQDAFTTLVRSTGSVSVAMKDMGLVTDLARAKNIDAAAAATMVAKVHAGAVLPLKAMGIEFVKTTENVDRLKAANEKITPAQLAAAKAADKQANSQRALGLVQDAVKGQAEAYGNTTAGAMARAGVAIEGVEEAIGGALAPTVAKAADKLAGFVNEMQQGTGQGGRFVAKLKDIWQETRPIVTWIGRATKNVAQFTSEHPGLVKLAAGVVAVGTAVRALRFVSAATGFTSLVKAGRGAARLLRKVLADSGTAAGEAAAANAASGFNAQGGRYSKAGNRAGRLFGKGLLAGVIVAVPAIAKELTDKLYSSLGVKEGTSTGAGQALARRLLGRAEGGIIPGQGDKDTVPVMATPGEFMIRKQVVEKFGPTFFAAINDGKVPQFRTSGGIISRAESIGGKYPYVWGGGHGRTGVPSGGPRAKDAGQVGYDCSGAVSAILGVSPPRVSGAFTSWGKPGPGSPNDTKVYANAEHVFAVLNGRGWGTGSPQAPDGGAGWLPYNHRSGFTIRHLDDGAQKGKGAVGNEQETSAAGASNSGPTRAERQARAGSRLVNRIASPALKAIRAASGIATGLGTAIEDAGTSYGQKEREFGQTDEDLGTAAGRKDRLNELAELAKLKRATLGRQKRRAAALSSAIKKYEDLLKKLAAARKKAKGTKRATINERMKTYEDRLDDLKAEAKALGVAIKDTELDLGDLAKDAATVAGTPDTVPDPVDAGPAPTDQLGQRLADIDLRERAGVMTAAEASEWRAHLRQQALNGYFGELGESERLEVMAQLRDAVLADTEARQQSDQNSVAAMRDLTAALLALAARSQSVAEVTAAQLQTVIADMANGGIYGTGVGPRRGNAGNGTLARY